MDKNNIGIIVATHGNLAEVLVETAERIVGSETPLQPFSFREGEGARQSFRRLQGLVKKSEKGDGVIILVDLFGGTPGSLALSMLDNGMVEVVTGVNLPMALAAATLEPEVGLRKATAAIAAAGSNSIREAGRLLD